MKTLQRYITEKILINKNSKLAYNYYPKTKEELKDIINQMRETIYDLRPMAFDDIGWESAIDKLHHDIIDKNDINVTFDVENIKELDRISELAIYRIINEACTNVIKHAKAKHLKVEVHKVMEEIHINICDDGIGIKESDNKNHFGMTIIKGVAPCRVSRFATELNVILRLHLSKNIIDRRIRESNQIILHAHLPGRIHIFQLELTISVDGRLPRKKHRPVTGLILHTNRASLQNHLSTKRIRIDTESRSKHTHTNVIPCGHRKRRLRIMSHLEIRRPVQFHTPCPTAIFTSHGKFRAWLQPNSGAILQHLTNHAITGIDINLRESIDPTLAGESQSDEQEDRGGS